MFFAIVPQIWWGGRERKNEIEKNCVWNRQIDFVRCSYEILNIRTNEILFFSLFLFAFVRAPPIHRIYSFIIRSITFLHSTVNNNINCWWCEGENDRRRYFNAKQTKARERKYCEYRIAYDAPSTETHAHSSSWQCNWSVSAYCHTKMNFDENASRRITIRRKQNFICPSSMREAQSMENRLPLELWMVGETGGRRCIMSNVIIKSFRRWFPNNPILMILGFIGQSHCLLWQLNWISLRRIQFGLREIRFTLDLIVDRDIPLFVARLLRCDAVHPLESVIFVSALPSDWILLAEFNIYGRWALQQRGFYIMKCEHMSKSNGEWSERRRNDGKTTIFRRLPRDLFLSFLLIFCDGGT